MSREEIALWIIVIQGFAIMYFERGVWYIKYTEAKQRTKWREDKRKAVLKKFEAEAAKFFNDPRNIEEVQDAVRPDNG